MLIHFSLLFFYKIDQLRALLKGSAAEAHGFQLMTFQTAGQQLNLRATTAFCLVLATATTLIPQAGKPILTLYAEFIHR